AGDRPQVNAPALPVGARERGVDLLAHLVAADPGAGPDHRDHLAAGAGDGVDRAHALLEHASCEPAPAGLKHRDATPTTARGRAPPGGRPRGGPPTIARGGGAGWGERQGQAGGGEDGDPPPARAGSLAIGLALGLRSVNPSHDGAMDLSPANEPPTADPRAQP